MLSHLGPQEIKSLTQTSKAFADMDETLKATDFNINARLKKFFDNPTEFRELQGQWNALLGGFFAQRFFARDKDMPKDLDVYTHLDAVPNLIRYLESHSYTKVDKTVGACEHYFEKGDEDNYEASIRVHAGSFPPILLVLERAPTTALLNLISWNKAYSLFPRDTFIEKNAYLLTHLPDGRINNENDYHAHGFNETSNTGIQMRSIHWKDPDKLTRPRRIGDPQTWTLDLDTSGIAPPSIPDSVLETHTFELDIVYPGSNQARLDEYVSRYSMRASIYLNHPVLKYQYVTVPKYGHTAYIKSINSLRSRLHDATLIELMKLPAQQRPPGDQQSWYAHLNAGTLQGTFEVPDTWTYYDEEVMRMLADAWEKEVNEPLTKEVTMIM